MDGQTLQRVDDPLIGRTIAGRYLIEELVGSGGMGAVYRGRHQVIDRDVAVKFLNARFTRDSKQRTRFIGEARAANQINHEHIINITDFGETDDGHVYLVMEFLKGHALQQEVERGPMPANRALHIAMQTAMGLARAHELDVVHRDVKPGNIFLVRRRRGGDFVKLLDFGIAHFERELRITDHGALLGTPEYMAPEMMRQHEVGPRSDLYSLGCVLYEMLSGRPPFTGQMASVLVRQVSEAPKPLSEVVSDLPDGVEGVVRRLLSKKPEQRHRDAHHLVDDLQALCATLPPVPGATISSGSIPVYNSERPTGATPSGTPSSPSPTSSPSMRPSRTTATTDKPTMYGESEEDGWRSRIEMYRKAAAEQFPGGNLPAVVRDGLQHMELLLDEAVKMRSELSELAQVATVQADEVEGIRERIGLALDELAQDESKVARRLDSLRRTLEEAYQRAEGCADRIMLLNPECFRPPTGGTLVDAHAGALSVLADAARDFVSARREVMSIKAEVEREHNTWEDLCFQMQQLKGRLGTLNASSGAELDANSNRANKIDADIRERLDALLPVAERVAEALHRGPEGRTA